MFDVTPLTGVFGAEVSNLDLVDGWDAEVVSKIGEVVCDHKVVVIRDQIGLPAERLADFAAEFGRPEIRAHPVHGDFPGVPAVKVLRSDGGVQTTKGGAELSWGDLDGWHTDGCVRDDTNDWLTFLYAAQIPPYGRDTLFADVEAAYERLSPAVQTFLDGLSARHARRDETNVGGFAPVTHPLVLVDPHTGRRGLYVNRAYTKEIVGLRPDESAALLDLLFEQIHRPQVQLRVVWKPGSLTIWDNRRTQHFPVMDAPGARIMHRVMVTRAPEGASLSST